MQTQIILNLSDNFNIYEHTAELRSQGFMLLSFLLEQQEESKTKIIFKAKAFAQKLGIHVSTLRRWLKKLINLKFVKHFVTADKRKRDPLPKGNSTVAGKKSMMENAVGNNNNGESSPPLFSSIPPTQDPFDQFMSLVVNQPKDKIDILLRRGSLDAAEIDLNNKPKLQQLILSNEGCRNFAIEVFQAYQEKKMLGLI